MKLATFEIEQFLAAMPDCQAKEEAVKKGKSSLRRAWNGLRSRGYEPFHIGYVWLHTYDFDNAEVALAVIGHKPAHAHPELSWELEEYHYPPTRNGREMA